MKLKPVCKLIGENGNIFNLLGKASRALKNAGEWKSVDEMTERVLQSRCYEEALQVIMEYVEVE